MKIRLLLINALVLLVLLASIEAVFRVLGFGYGNATLNDDPELRHVHPANYSYLSYIPSNEYGGHRVVYDEKGFRVDENGAKNDGQALSAWFLGDSFAEGAQVPWAVSFPAKTMALLGSGLSAQNMGVPVYSPLLEFLQLKKQFANAAHKPKMVFIQLCWDDPKNDDEFSAATTFGPNDEPLKCDGGKPDATSAFFRKFYIVRALRKAQLTYQYFRETKKLAKLPATDPRVRNSVELAPVITDDIRFAKSIMQIHRFLGEKGIPHYFLVIPSKIACVTGDWAAPNFASSFNRFATEKGLPFINLNDAFQAAASPQNKLFFEHDVHLNEKGHDLIAREIVKTVNLGL